jgi:hypothetical protein
LAFARASETSCKSPVLAVLPPELALVAVDAGWVAALVAALVAADVTVAAVVGAAGMAVDAAAAAVDGLWLALVAVFVSEEPPPQAARVSVAASVSGTIRCRPRNGRSVDRPNGKVCPLLSCLLERTRLYRNIPRMIGSTMVFVEGNSGSAETAETDAQTLGTSWLFG